jgi:hypothetical protein
MSRPILRETLQYYAKDYENAVKEFEQSIYLNYIVWAVDKVAHRGLRFYDQAVLRKGELAAHSAHGGLLDKANPGPIPYSYVHELILLLKKTYPDSDITFTDARLDERSYPQKAFIRISWA